MRLVAYGTVVPVFMMKVQSLDCASISSRAAWLSARVVSASAAGWRRASSTIRSAATCRWR